MTEKKFKSFMKSLLIYYNPKNEPDEFAKKEYLKAVNIVPDFKVYELYSAVVNHFQFFPKIVELRETADIFKNGEKEKYKNESFCYCCCNSGIVIYYKKGIPPFTDYEYEYVSQCTCDVGKNYSGFPLCSSVVTQGELDWLISENYKKYGNFKAEDVKKSKQYVTTFIKSFGN